MPTTDIEYLKHGDRVLNMRLFTPEGDGPHPIVLDLHPGAWNNGDLTQCFARDEVLAAAGIAAATIDFRQAEDRYPSSLLDVNYAIRLLKSRAAEFNLDADRFGLAGQSSGGHLAMLSAMRPADPRYSEIPLEGAEHVDASVQCVGMMWPVINPLSRYRHALRLRVGENPPAWTEHIPGCHDIYWVSDENMSEGNPMLALERGEDVKLPPAIWIQGRPDMVHDYLDPESGGDLTEPDRFAANYRKAGGECEVLIIEQDTRSAVENSEKLAEFFAKHLL
ncbi:MAG: alpha/beta hydrolase [Rhodospirillales bacterium]|nr:alpha/beta hydrolase [Rhodospirillales bacterium]